MFKLLFCSGTLHNVLVLHVHWSSKDLVNGGSILSEESIAPSLMIHWLCILWALYHLYRQSPHKFPHICARLLGPSDKKWSCFDHFVNSVNLSLKVDIEWTRPAMDLALTHIPCYRKHQLGAAPVTCSFVKQPVTRMIYAWKGQVVHDAYIIPSWHHM